MGHGREDIHGADPPAMTLLPAPRQGARAGGRVGGAGAGREQRRHHEEAAGGDIHGGCGARGERHRHGWALQGFLDGPVLAGVRRQLRALQASDAPPPPRPPPAGPSPGSSSGARDPRLACVSSRDRVVAASVLTAVFRSSVKEASDSGRRVLRVRNGLVSRGIVLGWCPHRRSSLAPLPRWSRTDWSLTYQRRVSATASLGTMAG